MSRKWSENFDVMPCNRSRFDDFLCKRAKKARLVSVYNIEVKMTRPPAYNTYESFVKILQKIGGWEKRISAWALLVCCNTQGLCSFITGII